MSSYIYRLVTTGSTNLNKVKDGNAKVNGWVMQNRAAYAIFVKLFWYRPVTDAETPTVGTTLPDLVIEIPALATSGGSAVADFSQGIMKNGDLFIAVTKLSADSDTTAVLAADGLISLLIEA